jgi:tetratricopeptide (TPR) repeat protein
VHISYGAVLTELGEYQNAIEHFNAAFAIDSESPYAYMSLANTFAAAGQFARAVATTRKALGLATASQDAKLIADIEKQLRDHRAGRIHRNTP